MRWCRSLRRCRVSLAAGAGTAAVLCAGVTGVPAPAMSPARVVFLARPASPAGRRAETASIASIAVSCRSAAHPRLAARLARGIHAALAGRVSTVALRVEDRSEDLGCFLNTTAHFDSASVVKVEILATLLREAQTQHRHLTASETRLARLMITQSDNDAASALWAHVGRARLRYFLGRAAMTQTRLGPAGYWGLTQITARDERLLLDLIMYPNRVLGSASRNVALNLMAHVIPAQRWGVPAGAPAGLTVHVKNGWLPLAAHGWRIHSIGCFTGHHRGYLIVALTEDNPTMAYGITTIQRVAEVIHRQLNPAATAFRPASGVAPSWGTPDEQIPPSLGG
jgi:Beta-lactamase enzyme family